eukprot:scaffold380243_cov47-Attheya_sp.AAC.1
MSVSVRTLEDCWVGVYAKYRSRKHRRRRPRESKEGLYSSTSSSSKKRNTFLIRLPPLLIVSNTG